MMIFSRLTETVILLLRALYLKRKILPLRQRVNRRSKIFIKHAGEDVPVGSNSFSADQQTQPVAQRSWCAL